MVCDTKQPKGDEMKKVVSNIVDKLTVALEYSKIYDSVSENMKMYICKDLCNRNVPYIPTRLRETVVGVINVLSDDKSYNTVINELWKIRDVLAAWKGGSGKQYGLIMYIAEHAHIPSAKDELLFVIATADKIEGPILPTRNIEFDPYTDRYMVTIGLETSDAYISTVMYWKDDALVLHSKDARSLYY